MNKNIEIMDMPSGTKLRNKRSGVVYTLGEWVNQFSRVIINDKYSIQPFGSDYINKNIQDDYEVVEIKGAKNE